MDEPSYELLFLSDLDALAFVSLVEALDLPLHEFYLLPPLDLLVLEHYLKRSLQIGRVDLLYLQLVLQLLGPQQHILARQFER